MAERDRERIRKILLERVSLEDLSNLRYKYALVIIIMSLELPKKFIKKDNTELKNKK